MTIRTASRVAVSGIVLAAGGLAAGGLAAMLLTHRLPATYQPPEVADRRGTSGGDSASAAASATRYLFIAIEPDRFTGAGSDTLPRPAAAPAGEVRQPPGPALSAELDTAPSEVPVSARPLDAALLIARGDHFLQHADVVAARLFYRLAADNGSAAAALRMAGTFDLLALERLEIRGVQPDPAAALHWYRLATTLGGGVYAGETIAMSAQRDRPRGEQ